MNTFYLFTPVIGVFIGVILTLLVIFQRRRSRLHRSFLTFLVAMTLWSFTVYNMRESSIDLAQKWEMAIFAILPIVAVSFYHSVLLLSYSTKSKAWIITAYGFALLAISFTPTGLIVRDMKSMWYGNGFIPGPLFYPYIIIFYGYVVLGIYELIRAYRYSSSTIEKNRYLYVTIGASICLLGLVSDALASLGSKIYPLGVIGNIGFLLICSYAILKYQLFDVSMVIRRGAMYFVITLVSIGLIIALLYSASLIGLVESQLLDWKFIGLIIVIVALLLVVIRWLQDQLDRLFHRSKYDYLRAMQTLNVKTKEITDLDYIIEALIDTVITTLRAQKVFLLLPDQEEENFIQVSSHDVKYAAINLPFNGPLAYWLRDNKDIITRQNIDIMPQFQALGIKEKALLDTLDVEILAPLNVGDRITGILVLSSKEPNHEYSMEEVTILKLLVSQMAAILDNARLYMQEKMAYMDLQREYKERTEFVDALVHEVKTPLTAMLASSELLKEELDPEYSVLGELASNMDDAVQNLNRRISELVQFSKLQRTEITLNLQDIDISNVIYEAVAQISGLLQTRQQTLDIDIQPLLGMVRCDPDRVVQILLNLLTNAVRYSPAGDSLFIKTYREGNNVIIGVCDGGQQLTLKDIEILFTPYQQGRKKAEGGLGLGLYICQQLVQLHDGRIWVESNEKGNEFKFSLPLTAREEIGENIIN
ncbi:MAG TPA: GAF domain-containing protein [Dehalococcoidia bacterium]|nr:GAF domain-containing protein [Dehalococcoidia bacterium]